MRERFGMVVAIVAFIWHERAWWMAPIVAVLLLITTITLITSASPLAPFVYPLF